MGNWYNINISGSKVDGPLNINAQQGGNTGSITQNSNQSASSVDPPQLFGFPQLSKNIVGRETDVELLLDLIKDQHQVLITGIGGLGKTTLVSLCATTWVSNKEFKYAAFINVETDGSAKTGFEALAKTIFHNTDAPIIKIFEHYNELQGNTLFVLDNIGINCDIRKYIPDETLKKVFVLGTSQCIDFKRIFKLYKLKNLSISSSSDMIHKELLNNQIKIPTHNIEKTNKLITDLTEKLDCHPLALEHAAAYIVDCLLDNRMSVLTSVEHYIKTINERLVEEPPLDHPTAYRTSVYTALKINIEKATSKSEDARKLLFCLSYLHPEGIDIEMFYKHPDFNRERIKAPIRELKKYSIISQNYKCIRLHRLIPIVYRDLIKTENTENNHILVILNLLFYYADSGIVINERHHFTYLIQNLNITKKTMSTLYIEAIRSNDEIINHLTTRLRHINCDMNDIKDWSALHYSIFANHQTFFNYFDTSEHSSGDDRPERFACDTWTIFHPRLIRNSMIDTFFKWDLISFFKSNENQKNNKIIKGLTTLHLCAAFNVDVDNFSELIDIGCNMNIRDDSGMTPILYAAKNMAYKLVFLLHEAGATYDRSYKELLSAASNDKPKSVLALLRGGNICCAASDFSKTLLFWAINKRYHDLALELIKQHTDINGTDSDGNTPLLKAATGTHIEVIAELLRRGANIEAINDNGTTPLLNATDWGSSEVIAELLRRGANINTTSISGETPLLAAARKGRSEVVLELLRCGANIDTINNYGETALSVAARQGHSEVVLELLRHDANIDTINSDGDTPLLVAIGWRQSEIALKLLRRGANIESTNFYGNTPLLLAAQYGLSEVALELLSRDANIEAINDNGSTPLLEAAGKGLSEVVLKLLRRDANIDIISNYGETSLMAAAKGGLSDVVLKLLRHGVNIDAQNKWGATALSIAERERHCTVVKLLNEHRARTGGELS